jgi:hypothetical protein
MKHIILIAVAALAVPALAGAQAAAPKPPKAKASPAPAVASPAPTPIPRRIEPRADQELKRMSEFLAKLPRFAFEAEEIFDEIPDGELRRQLTNIRRVVLERPNHAAADVNGDTLSRATWYDGKTVTVLDKEHNTYAVIDAPPTIDATLDLLEDEYGVVLPIKDILFSDPYAVLSEGITYGRYLGIHQAAGVACHHLAFSQATIEWQIWIDASDQPVPRKVVITYVDEPSEPQYTAVIRRWKLEGPVPDGLFTFEAPEGASKIDAKSMQQRYEKSDTAPKPVGKGGGR